MSEPSKEYMDDVSPSGASAYDSMMSISTQQATFESENKDWAWESVKRLRGLIRGRCPLCSSCKHGHVTHYSSPVESNGWMISQKRECGSPSAKTHVLDTCEHYEKASTEAAAQNLVGNLLDAEGYAFILWHQAHNSVPMIWGVYDNAEKLIAFLGVMKNLDTYWIEPFPLNPTGVELSGKRLYKMFMFKDGTVEEGKYDNSEVNSWYPDIMKPEFTQFCEQEVKMYGYFFGVDKSDAIRNMDRCRRNLIAAGKWGIGRLDDFDWREYV